MMKEISPWRIRRVAEPADLEPEYVYQSESDEVHLRDYWKILIKRRRLILLLFFVVLGTGAYFTMSATKLYTASATVKIEPRNPHVTGVGAVQPDLSSGGGPYDYYQTQFALLQSRAVAARVITDLKLESNKTFTGDRIVSSNPLRRVRKQVFRVLGYFAYYLTPLFQGEEEERGSEPIATKTRPLKEDPVKLDVKPWLVGRYLGLLDVTPVRNTRLVKISFDTPDAALSQALANSHVQSFLRMSLDSRFNLTAEAREFLNEKKSELRQKLEHSEGALNAFRRAHGVISVEKGENIVVDRLVDVNKQLTAARAQRIEAESLYRTVENRDYQDLSEVMKQGLVQQLKGNVAALEAERARLATIFKPEHPRIQELTQHIGEARRALKNEIANVVRGIRSGYAAALAKERALEAEADKQQQIALELKELGVEFTVLQEEVNANRTLYESVLKRLSETVVSNDLALSNMEIVESAERPSYPSSPNVPFYLLVYMVLGTMVGVGVALLREYMDSTLSTPDEVWRSVGLSTLGVVPHLKFLKGSAYDRRRLGHVDSRHSENHDAAPAQPRAKELITNQRPISIMSESYRTIRTAFLLSQAEKPPQVVVITSPSPAEGKTVTTLNLAIALAHDGHSVLVVDADLRKGRCHAGLGLGNNRGLSNVLTGQLALEDGLQETSVKGLSLLSRGTLPPNPAELLGSQKMKGVLEELRQNFQFILVDSPPVVAVSDAAVLSVISDGVLLVLDGQKTSAASTRKAVERLEMVHAQMLGVILNAINLDNPDYSYYRSYSSYYESADVDEPYGEEQEQSQRSVRESAESELGKESKDAAESGKREAEEAFWVIEDREETAEFSEDPGESGEKASVRETDQSGVADERNGGAKEEIASETKSVREMTGSKESRTNRGRDEVLPLQFIDRVIQTLVEAVGPVAPLIVLDRVAALGESRDAFPKRRLRQLLDAICQEIPNAKLRSRFESRIAQEMEGLDEA